MCFPISLALVRVPRTDVGRLFPQHGMNVHRAESLNGSPVFIRAMADIVAEHLKAIKSGERGPTSVQMGLRCPGCTFERCGEQKAWLARGGRD